MLNNNILFLMVSHHQEDDFYLNLSKEYFQHILVEGSSKMPGIVVIGDNDNINNRRTDERSTFGEMRGMHWCWKRINTYQYYGLMQYRRYFIKPRWRGVSFIFHLEDSLFNYMRNISCNYNMPIFKKIISKYDSLKGKVETFRRKDVKKGLDNKIFNFNSFIKKEVQKYDFIVPEPMYFVGNLKEQYLDSQNFPEDLSLLREIVESNQSQYLQTFDDVWGSNKLYGHNMFVMSSKYFEKYMNWLFSILFELEKKIDFSNRSDHERRAIPFISERLFTVFFEYVRRNEDVNFIELPVIFFDK
jgi:hypothetical protein